MSRSLLESTIPRLAKMTDGQLGLLNVVIDTFDQPVESWRLPASDVVTADFLAAFGDYLKLHHSLSSEYLDKSRFEAGMEKIFRACGRRVERPANRCNPGHDITVDGVPWSLKTQGDNQIREDHLHISKFMELGKGQWSDKDSDLPGLRDRFVNHMKSYDRIFQLRYFAHPVGSKSPKCHRYELVEVPKSLLTEARRGTFEMRHASTQFPKPGYCTVVDQQGGTKFQLYFDGGTERKLQIKAIRKDLCVVHGRWQFSPKNPVTTPAAS